MPVTANCGRQVRFRISSVVSSATGETPAVNGYSVKTASPSTAAARRACARRAAGISAQTSAGRTVPVASSSSRDSNWRRMRKLDGTTPEA